jgi:hypothetical protein
MLYPKIFEECNAPALFELKRDDHVSAISAIAIEHWHKWIGGATIADAMLASLRNLFMLIAAFTRRVWRPWPALRP